MPPGLEVLREEGHAPLDQRRLRIVQEPVQCHAGDRAFLLEGRCSRCDAGHALTSGEPQYDASRTMNQIAQGTAGTVQREPSGAGRRERSGLGGVPDDP